ncbi:mitochondrial phosphate carrier protein 1, mitochondrial isoform X1 [Zea mays]|uniref:Mitochondrial phosphate carrier protein 1, mitochondrial n=4 Tax=Zea mays TaxID=4577 RepID=A0A804MQK8_MAIZE|nr:mitochondrial phosphate carrier protein 1, mitochondrial isoform X1 [Zea mays]|eukprot:XP_008670370.1 mitochondrial phosphate carrier protein 1, mitochondrial isoform X1 [Zea mays]
MDDAESASRAGRRRAAAAAGMRLFSPEYYALCAGGGMLAAGATHLAITPLDVLKVNMQVNPMKYNSIFSGLNVLVKEEGPSSLWRGWGGKFFGYGVQGGCRFGLYEYFKKRYSDVLVDSNKSTIYFLSSASAQIIADVGLCPFESVKVRVQTQPMFAKGLVDGFPRVYATEGLSGFYRGLLPLWGRNLPFSMLMFSTFEHTVDFLYQKVIQKKKEDCSTIQQLGATCLAGYISGAVGTVVSNPADNIVSSLYNKKAENIIHAVKSIGFRNLLTRSLPIRIALVGPVITMQWFFYDTIKILTGLPTTGGLPRELEEANI